MSRRSSCNSNPISDTPFSRGGCGCWGTFIGAVVAYVYLVNFRFSPAGMVVAVVLEEVICMMFKVPDNGKMATITLIIVLIVSERSPDLSPIGQRTAALLGGDGRCRGRYCGGMARRPLPPLASGFGCLLPEGVIREVAHTRAAGRAPTSGVCRRSAIRRRRCGRRRRRPRGRCACRSRRCRAAVLPRPVRNARRRFWPYRSGSPFLNIGVHAAG